MFHEENQQATGSKDKNQFTSFKKGKEESRREQSTCKNFNKQIIACEKFFEEKTVRKKYHE